MKIKVVDKDGKEIELEIPDESKEAECIKNIIHRQGNIKEIINQEDGIWREL